MAKKVVHFVMSLWPAGVEMWLLRLTDAMNRNEFEVHIVVQKNVRASLEKEFEEKGIVIHRCMGAPNPFVFAFNFIRIMYRIGKTEVIHSHVHHFSGFILFMAWLIGIRVRVAHCHNDTRSNRLKDGVFRKNYNTLMETLIKIFANHKIAVSDDSGIDLYKKNDDVIIMPCGIDLSEFEKAGKSRSEYSEEFKIDLNVKVVMHVGRFTHQKNHKLLIEIFRDVHNIDPNVILCLVGAGELYDDVVKQVSDFGLNKSVFFLGVRRDIPQLLLSLADVFVFPSIHEGLPVSLIEAQAAGVQCVMSDQISEKAIVNSAIVTVLALDDSSQVWRSTISLALERPKFGKADALSLVENSIFNIKQNVKTLLNIYKR